MSDLKKIRIDKWLWAVRAFKTRSTATDACKTNKVKVNGETIKASYLVKRDETVEFKKNGFWFRYKVVDLIPKRVGYEQASVCYEDQTPAEELAKFRNWYNVSKVSEVREKGIGRPTKKDRRDIEKLKNAEEDFDLDED